MHRRCLGFLLIFAIAFIAVFTGCLGKNSSNSGSGGVETVTLTPGGILSINVGDSRIFTATGKNATGGTVLGVNIQFSVASGGPNAAAPLSVVGSANGSATACAGNWDPTISFCNPGTPGIAIVTAVINGVSSPPTTVYVHQRIESIQVSRLDPQGPPQYDCFSQGQTWGYQATAYSHGVDITDSVGPITWSSLPVGVVTATSVVPPNQPNVLNQAQATATVPGVAQLFASVSGTTSSPYSYTTCLIKAIYLQIGSQGQAGNSITVNNGGSVSITATAVDTLYGIANTTPLTNPPLTWSTTNPEVAAFSSTTNTAGSNSASVRNNLGGATLSASCTPPSCNIGVVPGLPIYSSDGTLPNGTKGFGTISVDVTSASAVPTYTAWAATTGCNDQSGCNSALFPVTPGTTPIGTIVGLPRTPNSMMFNHLSAPRIYFGSDQGLMYVDVTAGSPAATLVSSSSTPCSVSLCGKVLTISNDGGLVVVSDTVSTPSQVYIYSGSSTSAPVHLTLDDPAFPNEVATAAAFSPDQLKLFIATEWGEPGGPLMANLYVYSTVDAFTRVPPAAPPASGPTFPTPVHGVVPSMDGSFAFVAVPPVPPAPGFVSGFANCDTPSSPVLSGVLTAKPSIISNPLALFPLPTPQVDNLGNPTEVVLALDAPKAVNPTTPAPPTTIDVFGVNVEQSPLLYNQFVCNLPSVALDPNFSQKSIDLGQGNFTPIYSQLVNDGNELVIVARQLPAVLLFNVNDGTTVSVRLAREGFGSTDPLSAAASTDGSQVFIAACDQYPNNDPTQPCAAGSVHIVNTCGVITCNEPPAIGQGDSQQVPYANINDNNNPNMCGSGSSTLCLPNLIGIRPK